jgi:hypothetical protein
MICAAAIIAGALFAASYLIVDDSFPLCCHKDLMFKQEQLTFVAFFTIKVRPGGHSLGQEHNDSL